MYVQKRLQKIGIVGGTFQPIHVEEKLMRIAHRGSFDASQQVIQQGAHLIGCTHGGDALGEPRHPVQTRHQHQNGRLQAKIF